MKIVKVTKNHWPYVESGAGWTQPDTSEASLPRGSLAVMIDVHVRPAWPSHSVLIDPKGRLVSIDERFEEKENKS